MPNFESFMLRHRFKLQDLFPSPVDGAPLQHFELAKKLSGNQNMYWLLGGKKLDELNCSLALAEYMADSRTDYPDDFSRYVSKLSDNSWSFALRFAPYYKFQVALENLEVVRTAMIEAVVSLAAAKAGMETAVEMRSFADAIYGREQSKATASLLNFSALYGSYIDVCRRITKNLHQVNQNAYRRAINRIMGERVGAHKFIKSFRDFILHYSIAQPDVIIKYAETRTAKLKLDASSLLYSGFDWNAEARAYIQSGPEIDIQDAVALVSRDVERLIKFHQKLIGARARNAKETFEIYTYERKRFKHLQESAVDVNAAIFKRRTTMVGRIVKKETIDEVLESLLSDQEVELVLLALADKHRNLSADARSVLALEIQHLLLARKKFNNVGAYLRGHAFPLSNENKKLPQQE